MTGEINLLGCDEDGSNEVSMGGKGAENASPEIVSKEGKRVSKLTSPSGIEDEGSTFLFGPGAGDVVLGRPKKV